MPGDSGDVLVMPRTDAGQPARLRDDAQRPLALVPEAPPLQPAMDQAPTDAELAVEIADAARFLSLRPAWSDLIRRAAGPNPFLDLAIVAAAADGSDATRAPVLLAWQGERLVGVWAFRRGRPRSGLPVGILSAPTHATAPDATPVIDAALVEPVLAAMLTALDASPTLPKLVALRALDDGPVMAAFRRVMAARRSRLLVLAQAVRPWLTCTTDPNSHFARIMSGSRRRKLGQLRRRLATRGALALEVHRGAAVGRALERFLALEAAGWKCSLGDALARTALPFTRAAVPALASDGGAEIWELSLDGRAVSMAIILRQGGGAFDWKVAYDEHHGDCSPGVLLAQDYTAALLEDPAIAFADSCAADDTGLLGPLWNGRQAMADLIFDVRPGGSLVFTVWGAGERCYRAARIRAKRPFNAVRGWLRHTLRKRAESAVAEEVS
jgi:CelD/BcsL family acetyltransferase involved in cellulose biosynthesis